MAQTDKERSRPAVPEEGRRFVNSEGQVTGWPAKNQRARRALLDYLIEFFEPERVYSEKEVNAILWRNVTFEDYVTLRRTLCDLRLLKRERNGASYWRDSAKDSAKED